MPGMRAMFGSLASRATVALLMPLTFSAAIMEGNAADVTAFGAKGDGKTDDTAAIQRAIDAGVVVHFPKGTYVTGTLYLRSNGGLSLADGAKLLATTDCAKWNRREFCSQNLAYQPEWCSGAHLVCAVGEDVVVSDVVVRSDADIGKNDGIDVDCCRNVHVEGCDIETGDDGIAVRANPRGLRGGRSTCEDVVVSNCKVRSHYAHALRIGVGEGTIRDCRFSGIRMAGTRGGIWLCSKYGGRSRGVDIRDILFEDVEVDAVCWLFARNEYRFTKPGDPLFRGVLDGVTLRNVCGRSAMPRTVLGNGVAKPIGIAYENCSVDERRDAMRDANERAFFLVGGEMEVARRRQVRAEIEADGARAAERWLKDDDAGIRKFALYSLCEADRQKGLAVARTMLDDANSGVKALARELTRDRRKAKLASAELPLSQNPANDHEIIRVKSIVGEGESFTMPPKMECDEVEMWFGPVKDHLMVWVNDVFAGEWDPVRDAGREFRIDATKVVKWGVENKVWVTDERGKDRWMKFSVEVVKCGN